MLLNPTEKIVLHCDYTEIEKAIEKHFGKPYELPCIEEKGNYADWEIIIDGKDFDEEDINKAYNGKYSMYGTQDILNYLASKNLIPKGNYLISISW